MPAYNKRSPAIKRILREAKELSKPNAEFFAAPLEDNIFEWHFTIRGPPDTAFQRGIYHGRIILPPTYPMKPPSIMMLTPNGRFQVNKKICLSISDFHPETWQPAWSLRTVLVALKAFMVTPGNGAIGSLDYTDEERRTLAERSLSWTCQVCEAHMESALLEPDGQEVELSEADQEALSKIQFKGERSRQTSEVQPEPSNQDDSNANQQPQANVEALRLVVEQRRRQLEARAKSSNFRFNIVLFILLACAVAVLSMKASNEA